MCCLNKKWSRRVDHQAGKYRSPQRRALYCNGSDEMVLYTTMRSFRFHQTKLLHSEIVISMRPNLRANYARNSTTAKQHAEAKLSSNSKRTATATYNTI